MSFVPHRFLVRVCHSCRFVRSVPHKGGDELLDLPESCRIDNYAAVDGKTNFADVRIAWNGGGLGVQAVIKGKENPPQGDPSRPRFADGVTVWIDTRGDRTSHRASRYCHQFQLLASANGEPTLLQSKINRAQQDAPLCDPSDVPFRVGPAKRGYLVEAFLPAKVLNGFDPDEHPTLGFWYAVRDAELGEQTLGIGSDFPYSDDPSLWAALELIKD